MDVPIIYFDELDKLGGTTGGTQCFDSFNG